MLGSEGGDKVRLLPHLMVVFFSQRNFVWQSAKQEEQWLRQGGLVGKRQYQVQPHPSFLLFSPVDFR